MWNPPGHIPGVHVPGTTVPIPYAMGLMGRPPAQPLNPEQIKRQAEVEAFRARTRKERAANLRSQIGATRDNERRLALAVALALTLTGEGQGIVGNPANLHQLCPAYFSPSWQWTHDRRCLIEYDPVPVAAWFAREANALRLPLDGTFTWTETIRWGRTKEHARSGWQVGPSTFEPGGRAPFPAWVFPDGSSALSAIPLQATRYQDAYSPNFSPESLDTMVIKLKLDEPIVDL